MNNDIQK